MMNVLQRTKVKLSQRYLKKTLCEWQHAPDDEHQPQIPFQRVLCDPIDII